MERLPTSVFWPGEFHGLYSPWGHKESDKTKRLSLFFHFSLATWEAHIIYSKLIYLQNTGPVSKDMDRKKELYCIL